MSKNTLSTEFRKVDVDELDEEKFRDEPADEPDGSGHGDDQVAKREQEVKRLTQSYPFLINDSHSKRTDILMSVKISW